MASPVVAPAPPSPTMCSEPNVEVKIVAPITNPPALRRPRSSPCVLLVAPVPPGDEADERKYRAITTQSSCFIRDPSVRTRRAGLGRRQAEGLRARAPRQTRGAVETARTVPGGTAQRKANAAGSGGAPPGGTARRPATQTAGREPAAPFVPARGPSARRCRKTAATAGDGTGARAPRPAGLTRGRGTGARVAAPAELTRRPATAAPRDAARAPLLRAGEALSPA
jgi:hypothetical protein